MFISDIFKSHTTDPEIIIYAHVFESKKAFKSTWYQIFIYIIKNLEKLTCLFKWYLIKIKKTQFW